MNVMQLAKFWSCTQAFLESVSTQTHICLPTLVAHVLAVDRVALPGHPYNGQIFD